jgi:hypothetical protein
MPTLASNMSSLKNLSFGHDRPYGGDSGQPYIKHPSYSNDMTGVSNIATHALTDVVRVTKFLADIPRGPLYIAKQIGLQLTNPQLEHKSDFVTNKTTNAPTKGQGFFNNLGNAASNSINYVSNQANQIQNRLGSNRIWSPVNYLAQVAGAGLGKHIPRHGFNLSVPESDKYQYIVKKNNETPGSEENRIVKLTKSFMLGKSPAEGAKEMFSYTGGASSYLGIGRTVINSYYSTFAASSVDDPANVKAGYRPIEPIEIATISELGYLDHEKLDGSVKMANIDFRAYKMKTDPLYEQQVKSKGIRITDYQKYNTPKRIGVINTNAKNGPENKHDAVNMVSLFYTDGHNAQTVKAKDINGVGVNEEGGNSARDLIKFQIKALDNDKPGFGVYMVFRAFLTNFYNNMDSTWNPHKYVGRGESFYGYEGFTEGYGISFTIAAFSKEEMKPLYQKLNYLKSTMAPDYKANKMRGNIVEMTVGDYLKYQPGFISSLTISVPEDAPWEIAMNEPDGPNQGLDVDMHELPQVLKVDLVFTPIYNFLPRKSSHAPFIGIDDTENPATMKRENGIVVSGKAGSPKDWLNSFKNSQFNNV